MSYMTQEDLVIDYLNRDKVLTAKKAKKKLKIANASKVVSNVRNMGYDVRTTFVDGVAAYTLANKQPNKFLAAARNLKY